ncbi:MAG: prolyl oligopeptidase family serine peptidase, partial [Dokdonella sp.]
RRIHDPKRRISFDAFLYAPDGKGAYYIANENGQFRELTYHDFARDRPTRLSAHIPWDVTEFSLSADGRRIAFVANEDGFGTLHLLDTATRKEISLPRMPPGLAFAPDFSKDGKHLAFTLNSATSPSDAYVIDLAGQRVERWTMSEIGGLDSRTFRSPQLVRFPTFDNVGGKPRQIPALYYKPAARTDGRAHPVVIDIHGGPEGQSRPTFDATVQFLVNELGIAVIEPNVRGSSGYGRDYLDLDNGERREDAVKDIGALLDWIATKPELDAGRVGVAGGSYGGYMVLASMIAYGERVRAGVNTVGISNFVTFLTNTEDYRRDLRRVEYGDERDPRMRKFLQRISPLTNAQRISQPLFVAQGANDPRVPASEAEQIVSRVRSNDGEVWFLLFADEGHGFRKKPNADHFRAASMLFWQRHLLGVPAKITE